MIETRAGLLRLLALGESLRRDAGGTWKAGDAAVDGAIVAALIGDGLAVVEGRVLLPTPAGRAAARPTGGGRRILVERAIGPADGGGGRPARSVTVNLAEPPLGWLRARGLVSERQFAAGEQLHADWTRGQLAPRVTMRWDPTPAARRPGAPSAPEPSGAQTAARRRFDAALAHAGPGLADVLWRVACAGEALGQVEQAFGWPGRSAKVVLGLALDRVADFYRLPGAVKESLAIPGKIAATAEA